METKDAVYIILIVGLVGYAVFTQLAIQDLEAENTDLKEKNTKLMKKNQELRENISKEKAELLSRFDHWVENYYNENELIFRYNLYNFGNEEAKDVEMTCQIMRDDLILKKLTKDVNNIASRSGRYGEMIVEYSENTDNTTGICYVNDCGGNCELLYERIPSLVESYAELHV